MTARQDFLEPLLDRMSADGASDLLLAAGHAPTLFVSDQARPAGPDAGPIDATTLETIMKEVAGEEAWSEFIKAARANPYRTLKHRLSHGGLRVPRYRCGRRPPHRAFPTDHPASLREGLQLRDDQQARGHGAEDRRPAVLTRPSVAPCAPEPR